MENQKELEVYKQLTTTQEKFVYFFIAIAGAAIAFAIKQTTNYKLTWNMIPLGLSILLWAISFWAGCRNRLFISSILYANAELLKVQNGNHPETGKNPQLIAAASEGIMKAIESNQEKTTFWGNVQIYGLFLGMISFIFWHLIEMIIRTMN